MEREGKKTKEKEKEGEKKPPRVQVTFLSKIADLPEWMSCEEARAYLGLSKGAIYRALREGRIPSIRIAARSIRIPKDALQAMYAGAKKDEASDGAN